MTMDIPKSATQLPYQSPLTVSGPSVVPVLVAGLVTTAAALGLVWLLNQADVNVMGWYANYVIPIGALLVGLAAGSGYGLASWLTGVRIRAGLLAGVVALQCLAWLAATYLEYLQVLAQLAAEYGQEPEIGFVAYLHETTISFAFNDKSGQPGSPLGMWGYAFRLLELAGFAVGGMLAPFFLKNKPYCEGCQVYMKTRDLGLLPAGLVPKKFSKKQADEAARHEAEAAAVAQRSQAELELLRGHLGAGRSAEAEELLAPHRAQKKEYAKRTTRIALALHHCPRCASGLLQATALTGQGNQLKRQDLGTSAADKAAVRALAG